MAHILIIDDESVLLDLISRILRQDGHTVTAIANPADAVNSAWRENPPVDLLLTDVNMTPISGPEMVMRLVQQGFNAPVLFMSGYPVLSSAFPENGFQHSVIDKPFTIGELRVVVARMLGSTEVRTAGQDAG